MVNDKINDDIKMHLHRGPFQRPCGCPGAIQMALSNAACPGLTWKPLDTAIGQLLSQYCPGGCQGDSKHNINEKLYQLCWPF